MAEVVSAMTVFARQPDLDFNHTVWRLPDSNDRRSGTVLYRRCHFNAIIVRFKQMAGRTGRRKRKTQKMLLPKVGLMITYVAAVAGQTSENGQYPQFIKPGLGV